MPSDRIDEHRRRLLRGGGMAALAALAGCSASQTPSGTDDDDGDEPDDPVRKVDDWQYEPGGGAGGSGGGGGGNVSASGSKAGRATNDAGLAVGGAKDVNNFRQNVEEGYLPLPTDVSYEGLFYDYRFDTAAGDSCSTLFCPTYATATTADPLSGETERYVTVGLNSNLAPEEIERPPLNLVVVLDVSGSMSAGFGEYYYDRAGNRREVESPEQPKIDVAREALADLTRQLRPEDRLGIVTYQSTSQVAKPIRLVEETDMAAIRGHFEELQADGGTNLSAGLDDAVDLLSEYDPDPAERETRTVVLTDAMPNLGETSEGGLRSTLGTQAEQYRHVTFVGVGVDFNTEIVDAVTEIRGANYYSVRSPEQFERRLGEEFTYMVTPMVFDLSVEVNGPLDLERVYDTTAAEEATGQVLYARTLFPSPTSEEGTKGGVILAKVRRTGSGPVELTAEWEDRTGESGRTSTRVTFPRAAPNGSGRAPSGRRCCCRGTPTS
jgi:Ca-activated chloride channel family protein